MPTLLDTIPGLKEAVEREGLARDASFLPITETVAGFELKPMTLRHYLVLKATRNPLITGDIPTPEQLAGFLWLLSPEYTPEDSPARRAHLRRCRKFVPPRKPWLRKPRAMARWEKEAERVLTEALKAIGAVHAYIAEALQDVQPAKTQGYEAPHFSEGVSMVGMLARQYGWDEDAIMDKPIKRVLQYLKEIIQASGSDAPLCNPSDRVKAKWMEEVNAKASLGTATGTPFVKPQ